MTLQRHEDDRGIFQELAKITILDDDGYNVGFRIKQVSRISINPGKQRGNHYHKFTSEYFIVEKGEAKFTLFHLPTATEHNVIVKAGDEPVKVLPLTNHKISSEEGCEILILSDQIFDPENPDTYRLPT